jgi:hypothetical protein
MEDKIYLQPAPAEYSQLAARIVKLSGMKHTLSVFETESTKRWLTHHSNGIPILAYNPEFISKYEATVKWTSVALFASEIVYHRNRDLYGKYICEFYNLNIVESSRKKRLNVDYFIGRVLRHEGATLEEAHEVISFLGRYRSLEERQERRIAMVKGWETADAKIKSEILALPAPKKTQDNATAIASVLLGLIIYLFKE